MTNEDHYDGYVIMILLKMIFKETLIICSSQRKGRLHSIITRNIPNLQN